MARRTRRRRKYSYGHQRALQHIEEARQLSKLLGGTDADVKAYFFGLPESELSDVLEEYGKRYGEAKRDYAKRILPYWRSGRRKMSGLVAERLFNLLPPRMPLDTKYQMVRTLWEKFCPQSSGSFVIGPDCQPDTAAQVVQEQLLDQVTHYKIPDPLEKRFHWLADGDVDIAQQLLNHFLDEERRTIVADAHNRSAVILKHLEQQGPWAATIKHQYEIGKHRLEIFFDPKATGIEQGRPKVGKNNATAQQLTALRATADYTSRQSSDSGGSLMFFALLTGFFVFIVLSALLNG